VDMPNVNTIIILNANRLGISSLYQLRGRVGRSNRQAYAYVMTSQNVSLTPEAEQRLLYLQTFTALGSGYELSRRDMEMRGDEVIKRRLYNLLFKILMLKKYSTVINRFRYFIWCRSIW